MINFSAELYSILAIYLTYLPMPEISGFVALRANKAIARKRRASFTIVIITNQVTRVFMCVFKFFFLIFQRYLLIKKGNDGEFQPVLLRPFLWQRPAGDTRNRTKGNDWHIERSGVVEMVKKNVGHHIHLFCKLLETSRT